MIGAVHKSYAEGVTVHDGFNRAFTIHGTNHLRLINNFAYNCKGHNFFIEDAIEVNNVIQNNLAMKTTRSWSLLNTDQTPASFWITHPQNEFSGNHAAGSDRYGYWFDLQTHSIGPSADESICPEFNRVGEFRNNVAHSNGRYGLRIFHNMVPRTYPCKPITYDATNTLNPFAANPLVTMTFQDVTSWKNQRNGAIGGLMGDVVFKNFKTADNFLAGIEFEKVAVEIGDGRAMVDGGLIIGKSANTETFLEMGSPHGIISPRSEMFSIKNVKFHNFNFNDAAALGDCSHCFHPAATDPGARTTTVSGLSFTNVNKKIKY